MSKIDIYNKVKKENEGAIEDLHLSLKRDKNGNPDSNNDKGCFRFYNKQVWDTDMKIYIHSCYGYYGSSSAYRISSPVIKKYILDVLNNKSKEIIEEAINNLQKDIEKTRLDCLDEAKSILESL